MSSEGPWADPPALGGPRVCARASARLEHVCARDPRHTVVGTATGAPGEEVHREAIRQLDSLLTLVSENNIQARFRDIGRTDQGWTVDLILSWRSAEPESTDHVDRSIVVVHMNNDNVVECLSRALLYCFSKDAGACEGCAHPQEEEEEAAHSSSWRR